VAQLLLVGLLIFVLSGLSIWVATEVANDILIDSVREHMGIYIYHLQVIDFVPELVVIDMILVLLITVLSSLVPMIAVHRIKPINIIKAKE
jgi:ABC-type antimicrobial peptide transport system permease subunit